MAHGLRHKMVGEERGCPGKTPGAPCPALGREERRLCFPKVMVKVGRGEVSW